MNGNRKLFVFLLDALCASDVEFIRTLPHMGRVIREGALIEHVEPIYPSFTYPCHCAIITGNTVKGQLRSDLRLGPPRGDDDLVSQLAGFRRS